MDKKYINFKNHIVWFSFFYCVSLKWKLKIAAHILKAGQSLLIKKLELWKRHILSKKKLELWRKEKEENEKLLTVLPHGPLFPKKEIQQITKDIFFLRLLIKLKDTNNSIRGQPFVNICGVITGRF